MKKVLFPFAILIFCLFISVPIKVKAVSSTKSLIYDIENFEVTNTEIIFQGWAFIHNAHNNYPNKNLTITITAESTNGKSKTIETSTYSGAKNLSIYRANCEKMKGDAQQPCYETYEKASCALNNSESSCRYDNTSFDIRFNIAELVEMADNSTITFKINAKLKNGSEVIEKNSGISVSSISASGIQNDVAIKKEVKIGTGRKAETKEIDIIVSGLADTVTMRATSARVIGNQIGDHKNGSQFYWRTGEVFTVVGKEISQYQGTQGITLYELAYEVNRDRTCNNPTKGNFASETICGHAEAGSETTGYAYATWVEVDGLVSIIFGEPEEEKDEDCPSYRNTGSKNLVCDRREVFEEVVVEEITIHKTVTNSSSSKYNLADSDVPCSKKPGSIQLTLTTAICITQKGTAYFQLDTNEIYSGGGFSFEAYYEGTAKYEFCQNSYNYGNLINLHIEDPWCCDECGGGGCKKCTEKCKCGHNPTYDTISTADDDWNITKGDPEYKWALEKITGLLENPKHNAVTKSSDSNDETNTKINQIVGSWNTPKTPNVGTYWEPGEAANYKLKFNMKTACINRRTALVDYKDGCNDSEEVDGGELYYIPLKKETGTFPIEVSINDVNIIASNHGTGNKHSHKWSINYSCSVDNVQKLYDLDNGGFEFIYRPINMSNPFPNRTPGNNWQPLMNEIKVGDNNAIEKMTRNTLEYEVYLGESEINTIKNYNNTNNYNYTSMQTISDGGRSSFLRDTLDITNLVKTNSFNKLGECEKNCWPTDSKYNW